MSRKRKITPEDVEYIKDKFAATYTRDIASTLDMPISAVTRIARENNLKKLRSPKTAHVNIDVLRVDAKSMTNRELSKKHKCSPSNIHYILKRNGLVSLREINKSGSRKVTKKVRAFDRKEWNPMIDQ